MSRYISEQIQLNQINMLLEGLEPNFNPSETDQLKELLEHYQKDPQKKLIYTHFTDQLMLLFQISKLTEKMTTNRRLALASLEKKLKTIFLNPNIPNEEKTLFMQQTIIDTYYAIRRTGHGSPTFLTRGSKLGNQLEDFISRNIKHHGMQIYLPRKATIATKSFRIYQPNIQDPTVRKVYDFIKKDLNKNIKSKNETLIDTLLYQITMAYFRNQPATVTQTDIKEILVTHYIRMRRAEFLFSNSFANELEKFLKTQLNVNVPHKISKSQKILITSTTFPPSKPTKSS